MFPKNCLRPESAPLKKQCPEAEVLHVEVSPYTRVEDQIPTPKARISLTELPGCY